MKCILGFRKNGVDNRVTVYCNDKEVFYNLLQTVQDGNALVYNSIIIEDDKKKDDKPAMDKSDEKDLPFIA